MMMMMMMKIFLVINLHKKIVYCSFYFNLKIVMFFCRNLYNIFDYSCLVNHAMENCGRISFVSIHFTIILSSFSVICVGSLKWSCFCFWKIVQYENFHLRTSEVAETKFRTHIKFCCFHRLEPKHSSCCVRVA